MPALYTSTHTHTHTHIFIPFEDSEPTGLKVDIAVRQSVLECVDHNLYVSVDVCVCGCVCMSVCVCVGMHQIHCEVDSRQSSVTGPVDWNGIKNTHCAVLH